MRTTASLSSRPLIKLSNTERESGAILEIASDASIRIVVSGSSVMIFANWGRACFAFTLKDPKALIAKIFLASSVSLRSPIHSVTVRPSCCAVNNWLFMIKRSRILKGLPGTIMAATATITIEPMIQAVDFFIKVLS